VKKGLEVLEAKGTSSRDCLGGITCPKQSIWVSA
jgi:hypothetical protein